MPGIWEEDDDGYEETEEEKREKDAFINDVQKNNQLVNLMDEVVVNKSKRKRDKEIALNAKSNKKPKNQSSVSISNTKDEPITSLFREIMETSNTEDYFLYCVVPKETGSIMKRIIEAFTSNSSENHIMNFSMEGIKYNSVTQSNMIVFQVLQEIGAFTKMYIKNDDQISVGLSTSIFHKTILPINSYDGFVICSYVTEPYKLHVTHYRQGEWQTMSIKGARNNIPEIKVDNTLFRGRIKLNAKRFSEMIRDLNSTSLTVEFSTNFEELRLTGLGDVANSFQPRRIVINPSSQEDSMSFIKDENRFSAIFQTKKSNKNEPAKTGSNKVETTPSQTDATKTPSSEPNGKSEKKENFHTKLKEISQNNSNQSEKRPTEGETWIRAKYVLRNFNSLLTKTCALCGHDAKMEVFFGEGKPILVYVKIPTGSFTFVLTVFNSNAKTLPKS